MSGYIGMYMTIMHTTCSVVSINLQQMPEV